MLLREAGGRGSKQRIREMIGSRFALLFRDRRVRAQTTMSDAFDQHPSHEQLVAFDSGELEPSLWQVVEKHVAACDSCCRQLEWLPVDPLTSWMRTVGCAEPATVDSPAMPTELLDPPRYRLVAFLGAGCLGAVDLARPRPI